MVQRLSCVFLLLFYVRALALDDPAHSGLLITLERTACYGSCPVYKVTIRGDGSVTYEGHKLVRVEGMRQASVDPSQVLELAQAFVDIGYFDLKDVYKAPVTDLPTVYTSITLGGRHKAVEDYYGAPKKLKDLEQRIDEVVGSKRWVNIDAVSVHEEAVHGWNVNGLDARKQIVRAAERGDAEVIRAFISEGADMTFRMGNMTLLHVAHGAAVVKMLISCGADVNAESKDFGPPLVEAARFGDSEVVQALIGGGANVNKRSPEGETALMWAARSGSTSAVRALLDAGADARAKDFDGHSGLWYAQAGFSDEEKQAQHPSTFFAQIPDYQSKYREIEQMLEEAGAVQRKNP